MRSTRGGGGVLTLASHSSVHLVEVPGGHNLLGLNVGTVHLIGVLWGEQVHFALRICEHDTGGSEVALSSFAGGAGHSATVMKQKMFVCTVGLHMLSLFVCVSALRECVACECIVTYA
jgi:hypothetical protein